MDALKQITKDLNSLADPKRALGSTRYFKTGEGQYGYGDKFIGLTNPQVRALAKKYYEIISLKEVSELLKDKIHEYRTTALVILTLKYKKADEKEQKEIFDLYTKSTKWINNWDLVDISCRDIIGAYLYDKDRKLLYDYAKSENMWEQRIAIISTSYFIGKNEFEDTLKISEILLSHKHDLLHKAVGWMLREVGKRDKKMLVEFLTKHIREIPRTALRYAIEKFPEEERKKFLKM